MTAFVILHYRAIDYTENCVDFIKALDGDKRIVIVDNASPDGTGEQLRLRYQDDAEVTVLLNSENSGFARGNNFGVKYACRHFSPDYTVVLNNDVEIHQRDFCTRVAQIDSEHPFDVLGPDIVSVFSGIHQSPKALKGFTLESVRRKKAYVERSQNPILTLLSSGEKVNPKYWRYLQRRRRARQHIDSSVPAEGVVLHGSCVVFSRRYTDRHPEPFYCKTFMYYEMEILEWLCRRDGSVIRYDPSLSVLHYQYVASRRELKSIIRQSRFVMSNLLDSLSAAEALILRTEMHDGDAAHERELAMADA